MDSQVLGPPNYNLNEQIYESSDKTIKIFKVNKLYKTKDQKKKYDSVYGSKSLS